MSDSRLEKLQHWLSNILELNYSKIEVASADASFRRYFRVFLDDISSNKNALPSVLIAMDSPPEHEDNELFIKCSKLLKTSGVNVPTIFHSNISEGFLLITDLGIETYQDALNDNTVDSLYGNATDALHLIQSHCDTAELTSYDVDKLNIEMNLFNDWYIQEYHHAELSNNEFTELNKVKDILVASALKQPQTLVHRDFHCRNLLTSSENSLSTPGIIDYQDMLLGPVTYDLVSLFKDCYIQWPKDKVNQWVLDFKNNYEHSFDVRSINDAQWIKWFDFMGVQRHLKVLGIFCRLYFRDGKNQYMNDLPLTYKYLLDTCNKYPELESLYNILAKYPIKKG